MKCLPALLIAVLAGVASHKSIATPSAATLPSDSLYQLSANMVDQSGHALAWRDQRGRPRVVSMFYTSCRVTCPLIVDSGKAIEHALPPSERARIGITLISLDPMRDTPRALAKLAAQRGLEPARWSLLRPEEGDVRAVAGVLGVRYRRLADGDFSHTSALLLLDAEGRVLARTDKLGSRLDPEFIAAVHLAISRPTVLAR